MHQPDGSTGPSYSVNRVNAHNRYDVDRNNPTLTIAVVSEDHTRLLFTAEIPRTREMPDIVMVDGKPYKAYDTTLNPPRYRACMVAHGTTTNPKKGEHDEPSK